MGRLQGKVAIVFGCEMSGLTNAEVGLCQALAFIPSNPDYSSLNLGSAVQVFAYELRVAAGQVGIAEPVHAGRGKAAGHLRQRRKGGGLV